jgi:predicted nucleic acid-binding Zn ribbon protein
VSTTLVGPPAQPRCPVCNASLDDDQHWCLECGAAARTRVAPTPRWRAATAVIAIAIVLALIAIGFAVARLARHNSSHATAAPLTTTAVKP